MSIKYGIINVINIVFEKEELKMKKSRKLTAALTTGVMAASLAVPAFAAVDVASTDLTLVINDKVVESNEEIGQPFITSDGRTMIPLRLVSETLGYKTSWNNGTIHIGSGDGEVDVTLTVGADNYFANGKPGTFDTRPTLLNDRTYLPARDFMELYGVVKWDNDTRTVTITTGEQPAEETSDWVFQKGFSGDIQTVTKVYIQATNEKTGKIVYLTGAEKIYGDWADDASHFAEYYLGDSKVINGVHYVTVGRQGVMGGGEVALFQVPDLDNVENTAELTYVKSINYSTDFTIANGYLYYTQGTNGPFVNDPNRLYFFKIGDGIRDYVTFDLDFEVARCKLNVEDGVLVATEKDGTRHEVLTVPEADAVDVVHMKEALENNNTDALTPEEIACMPGAEA